MHSPVPSLTSMYLRPVAVVVIWSCASAKLGAASSPAAASVDARWTSARRLCVGAESAPAPQSSPSSSISRSEVPMLGVR